MEILRSGIIQYVSEEVIIISEANKLFYSVDSGHTWELFCSIPVTFRDSFFSSNRWLSRLTRKAIHHVLKITGEIFTCFAFGSIYLINSKDGKVEKIGVVKGSRPLRICSDGRNIYYGVYKQNKDRDHVQLFRYSLQEKEWFELHSFKNIRHIHGVFWDQYQSDLWVTTGDLNHEASLIKMNKGKPHKIIYGSQQTRAVDLLFTADSIFFATDAPNEINFIYELERKNNSVNKLQKVGGPIFWGWKENEFLFFSTVAEPSEVNKTNYVELWMSADSGKNWQKFIEFRKDIGHMKLFQYGQIKFPAGCGDGSYLWFTPYATEYDHHVARIKYDDLK